MPLALRDRAGDAVLLAELRRQHADPFGPGQEDLVLGQQRLVLVDLARHLLDERSGPLDELVGQVAGDAAEADVARVHPDAGAEHEEVEDLLALAEAVDQRGEPGADVRAEGADGNQVAGDPAQLGDDDADVLGALRHFEAGQALDRQGVRPVGGHRREVVHPVGQDGALDVGAGLAELLGGAVEVAHDRLDADDGLAVELHDEAEHPVGAGVLRPHVEGQLVWGIGLQDLDRDAFRHGGSPPRRRAARPGPRRRTSGA